MTIMWPMDVLSPRDVAFDLAPRSLAGPSSVSGFGQVVASDAGIWKASLIGIHINNRQRVLAFRAIDTLLEGRLNPILIPLCRGYQPVPDDAVEDGLYDQVPHSDDAFFSDDTGYVGTVINMLVAADRPARSVSMTLTGIYAGTIQPGQHFSIGERLYRIRTYVPATGAMTFRPPLREAVSAGDSLNFDNPVGRFRLATDDEMNLPLELRRFSSPTVNLIEDL